MRSRAGRTALHAAAEEGILGAARLLLDAGADVNALDRAGEGVLGAAVASGELAMIELLLAQGADPNHVGEGHSTPLESAIRYRRLDVAKLLRRSVARIGGPAVRALQHAAGLGCLTADGVRTVDYARWLLEEGARVDGTAPLSGSPDSRGGYE